MIVLDTNVLSALMRQAPEPAVVSWLDRQAAISIWTTSITVMEIRFGLQIMAAGKRRSELLKLFGALLETIEGRVLGFDAEAAGLAGDLMAVRKKRGRPGDLRDTMIAGIVLAHRATLATRNTNHFADLSVPLVDPWQV